MHGGASKHRFMAWVVKELHTEVFEELRRHAERDARRVRRCAGRVSADVAADLDELARLAEDLRASVHRQRMAACPPVRREPVTPAPAPAPAVPAAPPEAAPVPRRPERRGGRASLHSSPLLELFRATA
jgi:hypothetical protein